MAATIDNRVAELERANAQLRRRLDACSAELKEARDQQTATAEVLQVINSSPGDLAPVFDGMLEKAMRLCEAALGVLWTYDGDAFHAAASRGAPPAYAEFLASAVHQPGPNTAHGRLLRGSRFEHLPDVASSEDYRLGDAFPRALVDLAGGRTILAVPLRKDDAFLGDIFIYRQEVRPFTDKQIALLQNFAAQAVIAMENARLLTETREALEQQTATAEVLQVINSSPGDLAPVFDAILEKAHTLCGAAKGALAINDAGRIRAVATRGLSEEFAQLIRKPHERTPGSPDDQLLSGKDLLHITDIRGLPYPTPRAVAELEGARTVLFVPLRKERELLGYITAYRQEVQPFTDQQIALLQNFAAQAVIAIENARLLTETREALEQQTATAEVLQVINSSPGDLAPVLDTMLDKAMRLCEASLGMMTRFDGKVFQTIALRGVSGEAAKMFDEPVVPDPGSASEQLVRGQQVVHIADVVDTEAYRSGVASRLQLVRVTGARTVLWVALRKDEALLGSFVVYRKEPRPFTDKQIALLRNFAAQAVIAMENARLITETREALEQQTATAEVLQVINSSPGDLVPVFDAMLEKATTLCGADIGILFEHDNGSFAAVAWHGTPEPFRQFLTREPLRPNPSTGLGSMARERRLIHLIDVAERESYRQGDPLSVASVELGGIRTFMAIPLVKENELVGAFVIYRRQVQPFTDKQIALVQNFAAQAVIAMENARLLTETREALEQQTATAEVLQVINSSPGDLKPVFDAMLEKAMHLCGAAFGTLWTYDEDRFRPMAYRGVPARYAEFLEHNAPLASAGTGRARILAGERVIHVSDLADEEPYRAGDLHRRALVDLGGARTGLIVPLLKHAEVLGYIRIYRQEVRPFSVKQIALLQNFAAQAVIAMENARLLTEQREALERQAATAEVLGIIASSPARLEPVFEAMLANAVRICAGTFGTLALYDGEGYRGVAAHGAPFSFPDTLSRFRRPVPGTTLDGLEKTLRTVQLADCAAEPAYDPVRAANPEYARVRSHLCTPMIKDNQLLGAILIYRDRVQPFDDKQIELVENFAKQAVIAIENARLITETREALEQQTATAEVLQVINSSPGDLDPVFDAILEKAHSLCGAASGGLVEIEGEQYRAVAVHGEPRFAEYWMQQGWIHATTGALAQLRQGEPLHIPDITADDGRRYSEQYKQLIELSNARSVLMVPMRKDNTLLGAITALRQEVRPFSDKQIALLQNFAAQAVIAMENARLLTETREALEQQTATAEVLQVINSSPGDLAPVFDAMLEKATRLCEAPFGILRTWDGERLHFGAVHGDPQFSDWVRQRGPVRPDSDRSPMGRILSGERVVSVADVPGDEGYRTSAGWREMVGASGVRSAIWVALHKDDALLGYITVYRQEVRPFTDKQIALLQNFAAQAVIAMENARLIIETREALEQQTATAEVLQVINASPGDLAPVFDAVIDNSMRLCEATQGHLYIYADGQLHAEALRGEPQFIEWQRRRGSHLVTPGSPTERALHGEQVIHIGDATQIETYRSSPAFKELIDRSGIRTGVTVALRRDEAFLGTVNVYRQEVRPFSDKQIALLENFAAQAVIAMENARLLTETREALEHQTATNELLQTINSSPGNLAPVFDAMLEKAIRLCGGVRGVLWTIDGDRGHLSAARGLSTEFIALLRERGDSGTNPPLQQIIRGERLIEFPDTAESEFYHSGDPLAKAAVEAGVRSLIWVALVREGVAVGAFAIGRSEVGAFSSKQIALLQNFAAQAVIAMENARLLTETREALEQQTATAEVLQVINSSPGDLVPVFDAMLERAMRLCGGSFGVFVTYEGEHYRVAANRGLPPGLAEFVRDPIPIEPGSMPERLRRGEDTIQIPDIAALGSEHRTPGLAAMIELGKARTALWVGLRKDGVPQGFFGIYRQEVRPFTDKEIALLQNFAAQAVIAMENARLITETREALEQQTATAEVLGVINSSPGDLAPVFESILEKAHSLCGVARGSLELYDGQKFRAVATHGLADSFADQLRQGYPASANPATRPLMEGQAFTHILDRTQHEFPFARSAVDPPIAGTLLCVALRRDDKLLGMIAASRQEVRPFSDKQIALLQNFAAQAVIAMENARLLTETREALEQQTATAEVLQVINSSPGELAPVFDAILDKGLHLCEAAFGTLWTFDGECFHAVALRRVPAGFAEVLTRTPYRPEAGSAHDRLLRGAPYAQIDDAAAAASIGPVRRALVEHGGARTVIAVPLLKDGTVLGAISAFRQEVRSFSDKQIALLQNFAAQAVIAIENARLITETREALEQQTATAEVLGVINSSPGDLAPVFDAILEKAHALCDAPCGSLQIFDGDLFRAVATRGLPEAYATILRRGVRSTGVDPGAIVQSDYAERLARSPDNENARIAVKVARLRTVLFVPLRKDDVLVGRIAAGRQEARPFTDKQIALLQNFAAQAVIAMENARLLTETREALEQQTATAEVLQVINSSPGDLAPVFDAILEKAHTLCDAERGALMTYDGEYYRAVALHGMPEAFAELLRRRFRPLGSGPQERLLQGERLIHVLDAAALEPATPIQRAAIDAGVRTVLLVPLRKDGALLGYITAHRREVRPFSDKQIALLESFAAQAVIAMENARLLGELRQRTSDLEESLEYQTATSDVLKVISQSTFDLEPVLQTVLDTAMRLCGNSQGEIFRLEDGVYRMAVAYGMEPGYREIEAKLAIAPGPDTLVGRTVLAGRPVQIVDALTDPGYQPKDDARIGKLRSMLGVPLLREGVPIGVICTARAAVEPFTEKQIALVSTFADQAVIAIENARLLNDLQGRTRDLQESLEYQTATSDVLKVISQSASELDSVLDTVVETATRICEGANAIIFRLRDGQLHLIASYGVAPEYRDFLVTRPHVIDRGTLVGRTAGEQQVVHITDVATDPEYTFPESQQRGELHTMLGVPLIREGALIGVLALNRTRVEPFTEKQIALVATFADQAVIAIENARLFNELRARTAELGRSVEELKMLGEVGRAVSSTLDLRAVLSTILTASLGMTWATAGAIFRYIRAERAFRLVEAVGWDEALLGSVGDLSIAETETLMSEATLQRTPIQLTDLAELPSTRLRDASLAAGLRSVLIVPLVGAERIFGALVLQRREAGEFPAETVRLMQTLASQSVLAIQNARLFREIADKSEQLALASEHKSQFLANMSHELRTPLNAILGYAELLVDGIYGVLPEKAQGVLERVQNNGKHLLALINDVLDLAKIEAGQLALTLEDYALAEVVRGVVTATEPLAAAKGLKFTAIVQDGMPMAHGDARRVSQVLLNLAGNAIKFTDAGEVEINASAANGQFVLEVRDTGPGIADADQERIFGEFQQIENTDTRKKGGTGLGLAISKRMVEMQGGMISVESTLGRGSTFRVVLPVQVEPAMEEAAE